MKCIKEKPYNGEIFEEKHSPVGKRCRKWKCGMYRIFYDVVDGIVDVLMIGKRTEVYRGTGIKTRH